MVDLWGHFGTLCVREVCTDDGLGARDARGQEAVLNCSRVVATVGVVMCLSVSLGIDTIMTR